MFKYEKALNIKSYILSSLKELKGYFTEAGKELYLVGGCVRDLLLGKEPKDFDLCTDATPEEVEKLLSTLKNYSIIETGIKHGTVTVHDKVINEFFEITTYRVDGSYEDGRHPENVEFVQSLEEDLKRRDFTINSFAYDFEEEKVLMLEESFLDDLSLGRIRCVGNPVDRFNEDALRMLRAFRFASRYGFRITSETYDAIKVCAPKMVLISKERIRDELTKILLSDNPRYLELVLAAGLEPYLFDGTTPFTDALNCKQINKWHYTDVFHHTLDVVERVPAVFEIRWAALFHDIGKPSTEVESEKYPGFYSYYGHPAVSAEMSLRLMDVLKFSNDQKELIYRLVKCHDKELVACSNVKFAKLVEYIGEDNFRYYLKLREADASAHNLIVDTKYVIEHLDKSYDRFLKLMAEPKRALKVTDLDINGYDLINIGLSGKLIGETLNHLLDYVQEDPKRNDKATLLKEAKLYVGGKI